MKFRAQKRLSSKILEVGMERVWFDPLRLDDIKQAITRADIKDLIKDKAIKKKLGKRKRKRVVKKKRRGRGRIRMRIKTRKQDYVKKIRKMRNYLDQALKKKEITKAKRDQLRKYAKSGQFRSLRHLKESIK